MIRIVAMGSGLYGLEIESIEDDLENIEEFINSGEPIILVNDLDDLFELDINPGDIIMVEKE